MLATTEKLPTGSFSILKIHAPRRFWRELILATANTLYQRCALKCLQQTFSFYCSPQVHFNLLGDAMRRFEKAIDRVAAMLQAAPLIQLEHLGPKEFEQFVRDVLKAYGFRNVEPAFSSTDLGFDFSAQSAQRDPFGRLETVEWLIEAKGARRQPDTSSLRAFLGALSLRKERGLFVTAGQLTTPAKEWLEHASKTGGHV